MEKKKTSYSLLFVFFLLFFFASCSSPPTIDPICKEEALTVVPKLIDLEFNNNYKGIDDSNLHYFLKSIVWEDGTQTLQDRGFSRKTTSATNLLFYPFEKDKTLVDTWPHTKDITYYKKENGKEKSFTYSLVLKSTDKIEYALLYDTTTEKLINDTSSGKRMFLIEDVQVLNCSIETKN